VLLPLVEVLVQSLVPLIIH